MKFNANSDDNIYNENKQTNKKLIPRVLTFSLQNFLYPVGHRLYDLVDFFNAVILSCKFNTFAE